MDAYTLTAITFTCTFLAYYAGVWHGRMKGQSIGMAIVLYWLVNHPRAAKFAEDPEKEFHRYMRKLYLDE